HLDSAVAVACPEDLLWGHKHTVRSGAVRGSRAPAARKRSRHAADPAHPQVVFGIDDVDAEVRSVSEIVPFCLRINQANVRADDGIARNKNQPEELEGIRILVLLGAAGEG